MREHSEIISAIFGHNQDDQKGQEYLKNRVLEDVVLMQIMTL